MRNLSHALEAATISVGALIAAQSASASSFYLRTGQSAEGLGMQFAGAACLLDAYLYPAPGGGTPRVKAFVALPAGGHTGLVRQAPPA